MNYNTIAFVLNSNLKAVRATYQDGETPELFKTFDDTLDVDDLILVETNTRHNMTVCKVTEIDCEIDLEMTKPIRWAVQKVDATLLSTLKSAEDDSIKGVRKIELEKKRASLQSALTEDAGQLAALPLSSIKSASAE